MEKGLKKLEQRLKEQATAYDSRLRALDNSINFDIPDKIHQNLVEIESWKRWFVRI